MKTLHETLETLERELDAEVTKRRRELAPYERELAEVRKALTQGKPEPGLLKLAKQTPLSPYNDMTMKELILKALSEHFPDGATANELLAFLRLRMDAA